MRNFIAIGIMLTGCISVAAEPLKQEPNSWVKRSPLKDGPKSPELGYEGAFAYDPLTKQVIRWAGHNQGGGGEQNAETWAFDVVSGKWMLKEPNTSPPGVCCAQQNVFDPVQNRYIRFPAFSGSHGWHWFRENYLSNTSVWNYDLATNTWRDMRPLPAPRVSPLRCASWDSDHQVVVVFGGEGNQEGTVVYDPYANTWTRMNPAKQPAFRSSGNMTYDAEHKLHILFGSQFTNDPHTWAYDLRKNEWRDMKPETQPPTDRNDAVLAYDANGKVVIAQVRVIDKAIKDEIVDGHLETWAYDVGKNKWTQMKPANEPAGKGNRRRIMTAIPDQNLILMENYINPTERVPGVDREQQMWTYRYAEAKADKRPPAPARVRVAGDKKPLLLWESYFEGPGDFAIYRGEGNLPWQVEFKKIATQSNEQAYQFRDEDAKPGTTYHYFIRTVAKDKTESADSVKVRTQPRVIEDAVASVIGPREVQLSWKPTKGVIAGYHVECAVVEVFSEDQITRLKKDTAPPTDTSVGGIKAIGPFKRITKEPVKEPAFTDADVDLSKPQTIEGEAIFTHRFGKEQIDPNGKSCRFAVYAYRIRAVNDLGVESGPSPYFLTIPRSPQNVFAKEEGESCHLKWDSNPEKGVKGYRVYRMEGPKLNGPGQKVTRLTEAPLEGKTFTDPKATKDTKRYWIVAVDALGQEGIPSAPAWSNRQFRKIYQSFAGEWHQ